MKDYINYCTAEQTHRAYALGAPIEKNYCETPNQTTQFKVDDMYLVIPTTQQMIGWLREKGVFVYTYPNKKEWVELYTGEIDINETDSTVSIYSKEFDTYEQAELSAIDAALNYFGRHTYLLDKLNKCADAILDKLEKGGTI